MKSNNVRARRAAARKARKIRQIKMGLICGAMLAGAFAAGWKNSSDMCAYALEAGQVYLSDRPTEIMNEVQPEGITYILEAPPVEGIFTEEVINQPSSFMELVEPETESAKTYTDEDYNYLVMVLTGECQTSTFENQLKYGSVVLNRVKSNKYPDTIKGVCLDTKYGIQYASFHDGNAYRTPNETSMEAAKYLLENGSVYPEKVIYQAEFKQGKEVYEYADGTYFCCE